MTVSNTGWPVVSAPCSIAGVTQVASFHLASCELDQLPSAWFGAAAVARVSVKLAYNGVPVLPAPVEVGELELRAQPQWYGTGLASVLSTASPQNPAGVFAAMPTRLSRIEW
eukprot:scaffold100353_cov31-Tisochrysis_lutea.AAC.1